MSIYANSGEFDAARNVVARAVAGGTFGHDLAEADRGANAHHHRQSESTIANPAAPNSSAETPHSRLSLAIDRHVAGNRPGMVDDPGRRKTSLSAAVDREIANMRIGAAQSAGADHGKRSGLSRAVDAEIAKLNRN